MADALRAILLGLLQGLTEFLPVSSSGHLLVSRALFSWADEGLAFDAALHLGTFLAVLVYFRSTWGALLRGRERRLLGLLVLGTLPAGLAGFFGERVVAAQFRSIQSVATFFLVTAALLLLADRVAARRPLSSVLTARSSLLIGLAQVFALLPGLSRSGVTIAAGMFLSLPRPQAVEFSFLLALPITAAAGLEGFRQILVLAPQQLLAAALGLAAAFAAGLAAIGILLRTIRTRAFSPYIVYLALVGLILLLT